MAEPSELDLSQAYDNDTLMKNCFKDRSQSISIATRTDPEGVGEGRQPPPTEK